MATKKGGDYSNSNQPNESSSSTEKAKSITSTIANFDQPGAIGDDKLNIMPDVKAFAKLISSTALRPPLSIGLFGDWGSGKSFFMEKLHEEVLSNSHAARRDIKNEIKKVEGLIESGGSSEDLVAEIKDRCPAADEQAKQIKTWIQNRDNWGRDSLNRIFGNHSEVDSWIKKFKGEEKLYEDEDLEETSTRSIKEIEKDAERALTEKISEHMDARVDQIAKGLSGEDTETMSSEEAKDNLLAYAEVHGQKETPFYANIAQIKFNAWHFIDTNLWASLMVRVFEELNKFVGNLTKDEKKRIDIYRSLAITQERTESKQREIEQVEEQIRDIEAELERLEEERLIQSANYVDTIDRKAVWQVLRRKEYYRGFLGTIKQSIITSAKDLGMSEETIKMGLEQVEKRVMGKEVYQDLIADFKEAEPQKKIALIPDEGEEQVEVVDEFVDPDGPVAEDMTEDMVGDEGIIIDEGGPVDEEPPETDSSASTPSDPGLTVDAGTLEVPPELVKVEIARHKAAVMGLITDMKSTKSRFINYKNYIQNLSPKEKKTFTRWSIIAAIVAIIAGGLYMGYNFFEVDKMTSTALGQFFASIKDYATYIYALLGAALPFVSKAINLANKSLSKANQVFGFLDSTKEDLETLKQNATKELDEEIQRKRDDINFAHNEISRLSGEMDELKQQQRDLEAEKEEMESGKQLTAYLEQRMEEADYKKHLGLISTVREDLEKLTGYLHQRGEHTRVVMQMTNKPSKAEQDENPLGIEKVDTIDRIILYIDDLDRCPPDKVVEVLQAIHLMLAFPLFVVVVGVDVRWVSKALLKKYSGMLGSGYRNGQSQEGEFLFGREVSAYDYLEKIFQIPFRLSALDNKDKFGYISKLIAHDEKLDPKFKKRTTRSLSPTGGDADTIPTHLEHGYLNKNDRMLLKTLSPILSESPRAVKRFVNICRLIRSHEEYGHDKKMNSMTRAGFNAFKKLLLAFAMVTGLPEFVRLWLEYNKVNAEELNKDKGWFKRFILEEAYTQLHMEEAGPNKEQAVEELNRMKAFISPAAPVKLGQESEAAFKIRQDIHDDTVQAFGDSDEYDFEEFQAYLEIASKFSFRFNRY